MSQLHFDVSVVNAGASSANRKDRVPVPADDPLISEAFSPTFGGSSNNISSSGNSPAGKPRSRRAARSSEPTMGVTALAVSPLAAGKVLLKNQERFPTMYRIHILRTSLTRRKRSHLKSSACGGGDKKKHGDGDDDGEESDTAAEEEALHDQIHTLDGANDENSNAAVFVHPVRGTVRPGKIRAIAVLLPPPQRDEHPQEKLATSTATAAATASSMKKNTTQRSTSPFPRKVTFAGDSGDDSGSAASPTSPRNSKVLVRMQIEARIIITGDLPNAVLEMKRQKDAEFLAEQQKSNNDDDNDGEDEGGDAATTNDADGGLLAAKVSDHRDELEMLHLDDEQWQTRWANALELPTRTIEIVSVDPPVSRQLWLETLIDKKLLPRCDRLLQQNDALVVRHEKSLREVADFKAADREDKLRFLLRASVVRVPLWMAVVAVALMFLVGLSL